MTTHELGMYWKVDLKAILSHPDQNTKGQVEKSDRVKRTECMVYVLNATISCKN